MLKIATWNMNHWQRSAERRGETWARAQSLGVDVLLFQEAKPLPGASSGSVVYAGDVGPTRRWGTGILCLNSTLSLREIPTRPIGGGEGADAAFHDQVLEVSQPGLIAAADILDPLENVICTVVSVYGLNADKVLNGVRYTVTVVHRILSDITPLLDTYRLKRQTVIGGDLNVSPQIGYPDTRAHEVVIERMKAFGMIDCLGKFHDDFVQTHRARNSTKPWQDDWMFVSRNLEKKVMGCDAAGDETIWEYSDHRPVIAEFDL
jgi:exonuclease III